VALAQQRGGGATRRRGTSSPAFRDVKLFPRDEALESQFPVRPSDHPVPLRDRRRCAALPLLISGGDSKTSNV